MSNAIAIVAEAQDDFDVATMLIDRVVRDHVEWTVDDIDSHRTYVGLSDLESFVRWRTIEVDRGRDHRRSVRGTLDESLPRHEVAFRIQRIISDFLVQSTDTGQASPFIVIVKDTDGRRDVREALQNARAQYLDNVIGIQHTEMECWLIAGFDPESDKETSRLAEISRGDGLGVGFDPRSRSEDLTAAGKTDEKLSPKRVLDHLTDNVRSRAFDGLRHASIESLRARGQNNGLSDFLNDIQQRLIRSVFNVRVADC